ncbi:MAG: winged helix-turn-helix transcriptional regulator [Euryarchaeota archaeon]|nr:winged helix-turn-helix transcriptional regulator [Euryarchaeota archaeon]
MRRLAKLTGRKKWALLAVSAVLLITGVAVSATVHVDVGGSTDIEVPPLREGDRGAYAFLQQSQTLGVLNFEVRAAEAVVGADGDRHEGYRLVVNSSAGDTAQHATDWILSSGIAVRQDLGQRRSDFEEVRGRYTTSEPLVPMLRMAGTTLTSEVDPRGPSAPSRTWWSADNSTLSVHRDVCVPSEQESRTEAGLIDDRPARGISEVLDCDGRERLRTTWYTEDAPVPTLVVHRSTERTGDLVMTLVRFDRGSGPYVDEPLVGSPDTTFSVRHGPEGLGHPATGGSDILHFSIESAIETVHSSTETTLFRVWKAGHPDAQLAAARLMRGEHDWRERPSDQWRLLYASPSGDGYLVSSERTRDGSMTWVTDSGEQPVDLERAGPKPEHLITLESAFERWARVAAPEHQEASSDFVHWGHDLPVVWSDDCEFVPPDTALLPIESRYDRLVVGRSTYGTCTDPKIVRAESYVVLDAEDGSLVRIVEQRVGLDAYPDGAVGRIRSVPTVTPLSTVTFHAPKIQPFAAVTVPLIVLIWSVYLWPSLKVIALRAYSRVLPSALPDHPVRARLLSVVREDEGITASELLKRLDVGWGTLTHHSAALEKAGLLKSEVVGRNRHFFTAHTVRKHDTRTLALLRHPATRRALEEVSARPGVAQQELADRLGMTPAGALWHTKRLEEAGLIRRERDGRRVIYHPVS